MGEDARAGWLSVSGLLVSEAARHRVMTGPCLPASQPACFFTVQLGESSDHCRESLPRGGPSA